ncbi:prolipoprotein diacylglyceryl transferase [Herbiconiux sp. CPCC 203407]|uniref:Phosphatidylglycerol--prolipoprotein diacylglyceryl transferase n=1 Tax=Herbiconiux oxytropis TaxID=2970915 RepID=A0AA41XGB5_9MICO|nr:prolipoprotein diacylglyceryl transferase [Herbiconiux oxytropis]MCS5723605.1 prolipoprotein diacylglyceryl transferase [Herbiconiux oxytropis]MCS5727689.1 prolipoprotein diacylglyceryl transferase [Herbiconiux oxytropis]
MTPLSIPSPDPVFQSFAIGPLTIHLYALFILAGIIVAMLMVNQRLTKRGGESGVVIDIVLFAVPLGIVGARFYHVFTHMGDYFYPGANILNIFAIWDGGNALYGSLIGGAIGAWIGCRFAGIRLWSFADALAPAMLAAQAIGRLGNYVNHELFGLPTTLPWGLEIESTNPAFPAGLAEGTLFHPLFLYEIIWNVAGIVLLLALERKFALRWGKLFALYLIWYGLGRSWLEAIRIDPTTDTFLGIPANVWASFVAIALGIVLFVVQSRRHPGLEPSVYTPGRGPREVRPKKGAAPATDTAAEGSDEAAEADTDASPHGERWTEEELSSSKP